MKVFYQWALSFLSCLLFVFARKPSQEIQDPLNIFCGARNCYDILQVEKNATLRDIKKSYRVLTLIHHPDKSSHPNATETFRAITKAHDVLTGNESRLLFDYYLENPRDYFKVSGQHLMRSVPKTNAAVVVAVFLVLMSWFTYTIQLQKYERVVKFMKDATLRNLSVGMGGTKQTVELYRRANVLYNEHVNSFKSQGVKYNALKRAHKDPLFETFVDQVVREVKVEGGFSKPEWKDLLIIRMFFFPSILYQWGMKTYRRYFAHKLLTENDRFEMTVEAVGFTVWNEFSRDEQAMLIELELWRESNMSAWLEERQVAMMHKAKKLARKHAKKGIYLDNGENSYEME